MDRMVGAPEALEFLKRFDYPAAIAPSHSVFRQKGVRGVPAGSNA